jgi:hypothetical protein
MPFKHPLLALGILAAAGCMDSPDTTRAHTDAREAEERLAAVEPGYAVRIVGDNGHDLGAVRRYHVDSVGRVVAITPANAELEPPDAPRVRSRTLS